MVFVVEQHKFGVKVLHRQDFFNFIILAPLCLVMTSYVTVQVGSSPSPENSATVAVEFLGNDHLGCEKNSYFLPFQQSAGLALGLAVCMFIYFLPL